MSPPSPPPRRKTTPTAVLSLLLLVATVAAPADGWQLNWSVGRRVISTKSGRLRGLVVRPNYSGAPRVDVFLGIPYAEPPKRFMPPKAPIPWNGVKLATKLSPVCMQNFPDIRNKSDALRRMPEGRYHYLQRLYPYLTNQSEDCLYLNVYAPHSDESDDILSSRPPPPDDDDGASSPSSDDHDRHAAERRQQTNKKKKKAKGPREHPVIVFFHGESFDWNSGNPYDGTVLSSFGGVVVVTFNFRLGVFGFLRTGVNPGAKANFGLWDQIAALEWIQENIRSFGGDPSNVTLLGHGTGAACINLLMTSTVSRQIKGLFHRVVMMSGSALTPWALVPDPASVTVQIGNQLNCPVEERRKEEFADCLRSRSAEDLAEAASRVMLPAFTTAFGPVVDGVLIQTPPRRSIQNNLDALSRYDVMQGVVPVESYFLFEDNDMRYGMDERRRSQLVDSFIKNNYIMKSEEILAAVMVDYTNWKKPDKDRESTRNTAMDIFTDAVYVSGQVEMANLHAAENIRSYFYVFVHQSRYGDYPEKYGCIQGEELPYLFGVPLEGPVGANHFQSNFTVPESFLSQMFMTFVTNFAKTGDPNIPPRHLIDPQASRRLGNLGGRPKARSKLRSDRVIWPTYSLHTQRYMVLGLNMNANNMHYKSNEMALWLKLIPQLLRAGARARAQLENKGEVSLAEGKGNGFGGAQGPSPDDEYVPVRPRFPPPLPPQLPPPILRHHESDGAAEPEFDPDRFPAMTGRRRFGPNGRGDGPNNGTADASIVAGSATAWSLIVGAGFCIIILNACIFFGIYHQRDKIKARARLLQKQCVLRAVHAGQEIESADERELEMLCEKSAKEIKRHEEKEKHKSQPNLPSVAHTKVDVHGFEDKTKSTPARIGAPSTSSSSPNVNLSGTTETLKQGARSKQAKQQDRPDRNKEKQQRKQQPPDEPQYATVGAKSKKQRSHSERASVPFVPAVAAADGGEFEGTQKRGPAGKKEPFSNLSGNSPAAVPKRRKSQYDYQDVSKDYYEWMKTPDPEDPSDVYVSKSSMTLQLADGNKTLPASASSKRQKRRADTLADPLQLNPERLQHYSGGQQPLSLPPMPQEPPYQQQEPMQQRKSTPSRSGARGKHQLKRQKDIGGQHSPAEPASSAVPAQPMPQFMPETHDVNVTSLDEAGGRDSRLASARDRWRHQEGEPIDSIKKLNYPKVLPDPVAPPLAQSTPPGLAAIQQCSSSAELDDSAALLPPKPAGQHPPTFKPPPPPRQFSDFQHPQPHQQVVEPQQPQQPYPQPSGFSPSPCMLQHQESLPMMDDPLPEAPPTPPGAIGASGILRARQLARPEFSESLGTNSSVESQNSVVYAGSPGQSGGPQSGPIGFGQQSSTED